MTNQRTLRGAYPTVLITTHGVHLVS